MGHQIHSEPFIPNRVGINKDIKLVKGMVICAEPMFILGNSGEYTIAENGFDIIALAKSAHEEATIIIE